MARQPRDHSARRAILEHPVGRDSEPQYRRTRQRHPDLQRRSRTTSSCASITSGTAPETFSDDDLAGRPTHVRFASRAGYGVDYAYDSAGRVTSETTSDASASRAVSFQYDAAGNRTRVTWPDSFYAGYVYDPLNRVTTSNENGATSGAGRPIRTPVNFRLSA
jgi:YD repeat-containing protein